MAYDRLVDARLPSLYMVAQSERKTQERQSLFAGRRRIGKI